MPVVLRMPNVRRMIQSTWTSSWKNSQVKSRCIDLIKLCSRQLRVGGNFCPLSIARFGLVPFLGGLTRSSDHERTDLQAPAVGGQTPLGHSRFARYYFGELPDGNFPFGECRYNLGQRIPEPWIGQYRQVEKRGIQATGTAPESLKAYDSPLVPRRPTRRGIAFCLEGG